MISRLAHSLPPFPGRQRLTHHLARVLSGMGVRRLRCAPAPCAALEVDLGDRVQRLMWGGCFEPHVRRCLRALLRPGDVFLDVGAHIGFHSVVAAAAVGREGRVFAFEPDSGLFPRLERHLQPYSWAQAVPCAVWDQSATLTFERSSKKGESGWGTLAAVRDLQRGEHVAVTAVSLDDWAPAALGETKLSGLKMDAEGAELAALRGAARLLAGHRPWMIVECNQPLLAEAGVPLAALSGLLEASHYRCYELSWRRLRPWSLHGVPATLESVCLPREKDAELLARLRRAGFRVAEGWPAGPEGGR